MPVLYFDYFLLGMTCFFFIVIYTCEEKKSTVESEKCVSIEMQKCQEPGKTYFLSTFEEKKVLWNQRNVSEWSYCSIVIIV